MPKKLYVYYDPNYDPNYGHYETGGAGHTWNWIKPHVSRSIVRRLRNVFPQIPILNAQRLRDKMLSVVKRKTKKPIVIVFAQDVAPKTVLDEPSPTALVRQYLDCGGSIIWVGDIPFWYQATENGQCRDDNWWQTGAPANILGVNPISPTHIPKTKITEVGEMFGLTSKWTGVRPVLIDKEIIVFAETECPIGSPYQAIPSNWFSRLGKRLSSVGLGAASIHFDVKLETQDQTGDILLGKRVANAWFKNFDVANPLSGFFRIWDYKPAVLSKQQLDDLCNITELAGG